MKKLIFAVASTPRGVFEGTVQTTEGLSDEALMETMEFLVSGINKLASLVLFDRSGGRRIALSEGILNESVITFQIHEYFE